MKYALLSLLMVGLMGCTPSNSNDAPADNPGSTGTRGGGDTDASAFVSYAHEIGLWLQTAKTEISAADSEAFLKMSETLVSSMDSKQGPAVIFVQSDLKDSSGAPKMAVFSKSPISVTVDRSKWSGLDLRNKYKLAALEVFGLIGVEGRYEVAQLIVDNFEIIVGLTSSTSAPDQIQAGSIFRVFDELTEDFPDGYHAWLNEDYQEEERNYLERFEQAGQRYSHLPLQYRFDILVSNLVKYSYLPQGSETPKSPLIDSAMLPSEILASRFATGLNSLLTAFQEISWKGEGQISEKGIGQLEALDKKVREIRTLIDPDNKGIYEAKSVYASYIGEVAVRYRKQVQQQGCQVPTTFEVTAFKDGFSERMALALQATIDESRETALYADAEAKTEKIQEALAEISAGWSEFVADERIAKISNDWYPNRSFTDGFRELLTNTKASFEITTLVARQYKNLTIAHIDKHLKTGLLCRK